MKSVMYFEQGKDELYYSSYGEKGDLGRDIYFKKDYPMENEPMPAGGLSYQHGRDEDFPFLHPNGNILICFRAIIQWEDMIFQMCSQRNNRDLGKAQNMDFPIIRRMMILCLFQMQRIRADSLPLIEYP